MSMSAEDSTKSAPERRGKSPQPGTMGGEPARRAGGADVAIAFVEPRYPAAGPYHPSGDYPEYPFGAERTEGGNPAYEAVRESLRLLGLDAGRFGRADWNPLGEFIRPGQTVVLKPNFVRHFRQSHAGDGDCLITHGAVIRAVLDYAYIALGGTGRLIVADSPQNDADFDAVRRIARLDEIQRFYRRGAGMEVEVLDLRRESERTAGGFTIAQQALPGDPAGYVKFNLGADSAFAEIGELCRRLYGTDADVEEVRSHHHDDVHEYLIAATVLQADCVINMPKLKTHKKVGLTACLKNLVGTAGDKNWLPHHREGTPSEGGDQFADDRAKRRLERVLVNAFKRWMLRHGRLGRFLGGPAKGLGKVLFGDTNSNTIRSGNWYGNDTTWRMVLDLARIFVYGTCDGRLHERPARRVLNLVDGIVAGQGNGPLDAVAKPAGVVVAGTNMPAVDLACARLMGFGYRRIPLLQKALEPHRYPLVEAAYDEIRSTSNRSDWSGALAELRGEAMGFEPHFGWKGWIEEGL
ncbi:MAG: DUF362 domain-containing protein [Planctomycetes bacterium]|nr:DUF362 domain-containing protein [Planctomycetota bacterium]